MDLFGPAHMSMLVLTVVLSFLAVWGARRLRGSTAEQRITRSVGWAFLVVSTAWLAWGWLPQNWVLEESLPLHLSDVLRVVTSIALIWRPKWALAVIYYWGLTLNVQSIITADLNYYGYPAVEFIMYWLLHIVVFVAPLVFVFGLGYRPSWRGYATALAITLGWAAITFTINSLVGTNYGYLNGAPEGPSLLDALGPWPLYLISEIVLVATIWALMTLPWVILTRRHRRGTSSSTSSPVHTRSAESESPIP